MKKQIVSLYVLGALAVGLVNFSFGQGSDRGERFRPDRPERTEKPEKPSPAEKPEKADKPSKPDRPDWRPGDQTKCGPHEFKALGGCVGPRASDLSGKPGTGVGATWRRDF